jgi:hypothetical protein
MGPGDEFYLSADFSISCESSRYTVGVSWAVLMLLVYPVGIPCVYLWQLYRIRNVIKTRNSVFYVLDSGGKILLNDSAEPIVDEEKTRQRDDVLLMLQFLYWQYKPTFWYWEVVDLLRKVFLCGWLVVFGHGTTLQVIVGGMLCLVFIKVYGVYSPYLDPDAGMTAECSIWQIFAFFYIALLLRDEGFSASRAVDLDGALMFIVVFGFLLESYNAWRHFADGGKRVESTVVNRENSYLSSEDAVKESLPSDSWIKRGGGEEVGRVEMNVVQDYDRDRDQDSQEAELVKLKPTGSASKLLPNSSIKVFPGADLDDEEEEEPHFRGLEDDEDDEDEDDENVLMC